jgi:ABC-2 type transport system ATP-binding protein
LTHPNSFSIFEFYPMITVENLSKRYAGGEAVKGISFSVEKGEVVGFLGPNGAGKSTTMRMITGYLPATDGKIEVAGAKLPEQSLLVRQRIGYMPENVPLYPEMRVEEFLEYRGRLKRVARGEIAQRVDLVLDQCGLADVRRKIIGTLSKGYRQRVGLADALIHNPSLLILDEPTAGLDPHQIRSFRELIKELGKDRTILLSTHILSEVEMVCSRAIIINRGRIEASDTLANLEKRVQAGALQIEVKAEPGSVREKLKGLPDVSMVTELNRAGDWVSFEVVAVPGKDIRGEVDQLIKRENWPLREFRREKARLEDVFVELTQE